MLIVVCLCQPVYVSAARKGSITVSYPCAGMKVQLYNVAYQGKKSDYILKKRFAKYPIKLNKLTKAEWAGQAQALAAYIQRDDLSANRSGSTDSTGKIKFRNLRQGMYLIMTQVHEENGYTYKAMPYFVSIPGKSVNGKTQYHVTTTAKYEKTSNGNNETEKDYKVAKVWSDKGHENIRPKNITVQLLRDGSVYQEVMLNKENNWQYTWKNLSSKYQWEAIEKSKPNDYFVSVSKQETSIVIKNVYWDDEYYNDSTTTERSKTTTKKESTTDNNNETTKQPTKKLPQTGQVWWPLPFLAFGGILCIGIGMTKQKREDNEKE